MAKTYAAFIIVALLVGIAIGQGGNRFELQSLEEIDGGAIKVYAIHDKGSGAEMLCATHYVYVGSDISCVTTGRNWK